MNESTPVLFGLEAGFVVASVERLDQDDLRVVIEHRDREAASPGCGVITTGVKDRTVVRVKDLDASGQAVRNLENYQRRVLSTIALTRARRDAA